MSLRLKSCATSVYSCPSVDASLSGWPQTSLYRPVKCGVLRMICTHCAVETCLSSVCPATSLLMPPVLSHAVNSS